MDPLCLSIADSQPCPGTLCGSLRRKGTPVIFFSAIRLRDRALNYTTHGPPSAVSCREAAGYGCEFEREADAWWKVRVGGGEKPVKSYEICPLNNQRPNQFVQRPREAGGLQRNVWSGRSLSVHPSPYLRQTHNSQRVCLGLEKRWPGGVWLRRGTKHFLLFHKCCNAHKFTYFTIEYFQLHSDFVYFNCLFHLVCTEDVC